MNEYVKVMKSWKDFSGRARRREYWMFVLFNVIFGIVANIIDGIIGTNGLIGGLYSLVVLVPALAVSVRRLHDVGKSGWWILICLVPVIGALYFLYLTILEGQQGTNEYGPNPKEVNNTIQ